MKTWLDFMLEPADLCSNPGQQVEPEYKLHYDKKGAKELVIDGQRNTYDDIQSHADSVDLNLIMKRYAMGDYSVLNKRDGQYLDVSDLPESLGEWFNFMEGARDIFYKLDPSERDKYNHSVEQFLVENEPKKESTDVPVEKGEINE